MIRHVRAAGTVLPLILASCSQLTELSARFIDGRLAFVALDGSAVDCVRAFGVSDIASGEVMWEIGDLTRPDCLTALPIRYGQDAAAVRQRAKPLVPGRRYLVDGSASGGNSLTGRFVLTRAAAVRVTDVPWQQSDERVISNDIENNLQ